MGSLKYNFDEVDGLFEEGHDGAGADPAEEVSQVHLNFWSKL